MRPTKRREQRWQIHVKMKGYIYGKRDIERDRDRERHRYTKVQGRKPPMYRGIASKQADSMYEPSLARKLVKLSCEWEHRYNTDSLYPRIAIISIQFNLHAEEQ